MASSSKQKRGAPKPPECIWSQAEVVRRKACEKGFDCTPCHFDRTLRRTAEENRRLSAIGLPPSGKKGQIVSWQEKLLLLPTWRRPCIHHLKGCIEFRACNQEYRCGSCEFDQYFEDQFTVHTVVRPVEVSEVSGFKIPQGFYLHRGHTWVKIEEGTSVRIGLDDFALRLLGSPDRIEAPLLGKAVSRNKAAIHLYREPHHAEVLSPVEGVVTAINVNLRDDARHIEQDPYADGWILKVDAPDLRTDLKNLMIGKETESFLEKESDDLFRIIEETAGPLAADGGDIGSNLFGNLPAMGWERLTHRFLRTK